MSEKRVSDMTQAEIQALAAPRPVTYQDAQSRYQGTTAARERFDALTMRDALARALENLKARGEYDPARHSAEQHEPLTASEHLEVLAAGEVLARYYRHPCQIHTAVLAGATWTQIAAARGTDEARGRQDYREWADGQHTLWQHYEGKLGMDDAEYGAALDRASSADREAGS